MIRRLFKFMKVFDSMAGLKITAGNPLVHCALLVFAWGLWSEDVKCGKEEYGYV